MAGLTCAKVLTEQNAGIAALEAAREVPGV